MSKESRKRAIDRVRAQQAHRRRLVRFAGAGVAAALALGLALGLTLSRTSGGAPAGTNFKLAGLSTLGPLQPAPPPGATGPEGVPVPDAPALAGPGTAANGQAIDGIGCQSMEQSLFHIHAHLTIFVNGAERQVPAAIGIPGAQSQSTPSGEFVPTGSCFYWLHTHAADGIIHIESPVDRSFALGNLFDEWGQPLSPTQVGPAQGNVTAIYNGQVYQGDPRDIPLTAHAQIQLEVGTPLVSPEQITFPSGL